MAREYAGTVVVRGIVPRQPSAGGPARGTSSKTRGALDDDTTAVHVGGQVVAKSDRIRKSGTRDHHHDVVLLKLRQSRGATPRI